MSTLDRSEAIQHANLDSAASSPRRVSWGAIFAGSVIGIAMIVLLSLLGVGIGAATIDPASGETPGAVAGLTGSVVFFAIVQLVALFAGGYIAARLAGIPLTQTSMLHGAAVWALATFAMFWLATTSVGMLASGVASTLTRAGEGLATTAQAAIPDDLSLDSLPDINPESLPPELRRALERQGMTVKNAREETIAAFRAVVSKEESSAAASEATETAKAIVNDPTSAGAELEELADRLLGGSEAVLSEEDRQQALTQMQVQLGITEEEAQQLIDEASQQMEEAQLQVEQAITQAQEQAVEAAEAAAAAVSGAAFGAFVASLLGLIAAAAGGFIGRPKQVA